MGAQRRPLSLFSYLQPLTVQKPSLYIMIAGVVAGLASMLYFLSLAGALPVVAAAAVVLIGAGLFAWYAGRAGERMGSEERPLTSVSYSVMMVAVALFVSKADELAERYGGWDAWAIWDLHARYLASGQWRNMFLNTVYAHPDYPLLVPGFTGFIARLFSDGKVEMVSFVYQCAITLFIPFIVYLECRRKNTLVAIILLFMLLLDRFYVFQGLAGYADTTVAFFLLCGLVCMNNDVDDKLLVLAGACMGCCVWTKNEGTILAAIFTLFYARDLVRSGKWKYYVAGLALPVITFIVFKVGYAPDNDMLGQQSGKTLMQLFDGKRYALIYEYFTRTIGEKYYWVAVIFLLYVLLLLIRRQWPARQVTLVLTCLGAYCGVYLFSVQGLEWHLATSVDRLLHQLMPAMLYAVAWQMQGSSSLNLVWKSGKIDN